MGIDPVTHKSFSHLMAEIATTLGPPQVANLTEAALGCFKDEMLHLLTKKRIDFQLQPTNSQGKVRPRKQVYFFYLFLCIDKFVIGFVHNKTCISGELTAHKPDKVLS